jgi:hypothetical protein
MNCKTAPVLSARRRPAPPPPSTTPFRRGTAARLNALLAAPRVVGRRSVPFPAWAALPNPVQTEAGERGRRKAALSSGARAAVSLTPSRQDQKEQPLI